MTSNPPSILQRTQKWLIRKGAENQDAFILGKLQDEADHYSNPSNRHKPILFFNASTRLEGMSLNSAFSILTSISLRRQGVVTIHWVCKRGMSHCVLGTDRANPCHQPPCNKCIAQSNRTYKGASVMEFGYHPSLELAAELEGMDFRKLSEFKLDGIPLGATVIPSLRWMLRKHHIEETKPNRVLLKEYILSAENIARQLRLLLMKVQPKAIVLFNGQFYPEAVVKLVAIQKGIRVVTHEVGMQPMTAFFTEGEATAYPVMIPEGFQLSTKQEKTLDQYLQQRFQGDFSMAGIRFWPKMNGLDASFIKKVKHFKQVVPVFTNVIFDTSQGHANVIFGDMFAWLDAVLVFINKHPETLFVIRAHPDEGRPGKESRESVASWVMKNQIGQLPNVKFVDFNEFFNSYELIGISKFVMVYNSTIGLEASILGKTVLCGGKARYTQYPTVILPKNVREFNLIANDLLVAKKISSPQNYQQNARKFLYFQLFQTDLSFSPFLEQDPEWKGYVHLKRFSGKMLDPKENSIFKVLSKGIMNGQPFVIDPDEATKKEKI